MIKMCGCFTNQFLFCLCFPPGSLNDSEPVVTDHLPWSQTMLLTWKCSDVVKFIWISRLHAELFFLHLGISAISASVISLNCFFCIIDLYLFSQITIDKDNNNKDDCCNLCLKIFAWNNVLCEIFCLLSVWMFTATVCVYWFIGDILGHVSARALWKYGISPPRFLAECCKRRLNQSSFVLLYFALFAFYPHDAMLARVIAIATCPSVCPSVCHAPVLCQNEEC